MEEYSYTSTHPVGHTGPATGLLYIYLTSPVLLHLHYITLQNCIFLFLLRAWGVLGSKLGPETVYREVASFLTVSNGKCQGSASNQAN